jgi:hypothetical protein
MTVPRIAVSLTLVAIWLSGASLAGQRAGAIETIAPAAARVGDPVTITGRGFGAFNVQVSVGGVPAPVLSANGNRVTFRVPEHAPSGATQVIAVNPGGHSGSIGFHVIQGILLPGDASARMKDAVFDLHPALDASGDEVVDGIIMTGLEVRFAGDATVGQVNAALLAVNGGIVGMSKGLTAVSIAVPRASTVDALKAMIATLERQPGVRLASLAEAAQPKQLFFANALTPETAEQLHHLLPSRFPAAWNAGAYLVDVDCASDPVPLLVADYFSIQPPDALAPYLPSFRPPVAAATGFQPFESHGWRVATVAAGDGIGANPFVSTGCLDLRLVQVGGFRKYFATDAIAGHLPSGTHSIVNLSIGFTDSCVGTRETPGEPCNPPNDRLTFASTRADDALYWKQRTSARWADFLIVVAAGNERSDLSSIIYPGMKDARYGSDVAIAQLPDPQFHFVADQTLWQPDAAFIPFGFTSLSPDVSQQQHLADALADAGDAGRMVADNVIVVGSATRQTPASVLSAHVPPEQLGVSVFSDDHSDVLAVGEQALGAVENDGTSFAAPIVSGLVSYLWSLSFDLQEAPIATTKALLLANARNHVIDAYASVLSLDPVGDLQPGLTPMRETILDVNRRNGFEAADVQDFVQHFFVIDASGAIVGARPAASADFSRYDLNGDGFTTAGALRERFDLDRHGSTQFGAAAYGVVTQHINGVDVRFDENALTDLEILCYYAYSPLFSADPVDRDQRDQLLKGRCAVSLEPASITLQTGAQQQFRAHTPDNGAVTFSATGGTITSDGVLTAPANPGTVTVRASSVSNPDSFAEATVTVVSGTTPGHGSGSVRANASAQNDPECRDLALEVEDVQSFSKSFHCVGAYETVDHRILKGTADARTDFTELSVGGELRSASATGVYTTSTSGPLNPDLPLAENNTSAESEGSYKLVFTVPRASQVRLIGTLTGNAASTFLQWSCGGTVDHQAGAGGVDQTFALPAGGTCVIQVASSAVSFLQSNVTTNSPAAGFGLQVTVQ